MLTPSPTIPNSRIDPAWRPWGFVGWTIVIGAFAIGFWQFPLRAVGPELDHLPGDIIDARLNNYILEHGYRYLNGQDPTFWDAGMFYPAPRVVAYSDAHIGMLPVYASARALGSSPERAFQIWFLVPFALNYASAIIASRRLNASAFAATVAAYFFAFGINQVTSVALHAQLVPRFLVPFALVFGREWLIRPNASKLVLLATCVVGQAYLTIYIGYFLAIVLAVQSLLTARIERKDIPWSAVLRPGSRAWAVRGLIVLLALMALLPLAVPYVRASGDHFVPGPGDVRGTHPTPQTWVFSSRLSIHAAWTDEVFPPPDEMTAFCEKQQFPGVVPFLALIGGALLLSISPAFRRGYVAVALLTVLVVLLLVTNAFGVPPYEPVLYLPGAGGIRVIARITLVLAFPWGFFVGAMLDRLLDRVVRFRTVAVFLMLGVAIADQWVVPTDGSSEWKSLRFPVKEAEDRRERVIAAIRTHPNPRLVYVFPGRNEGEWLFLQVDAMWASQSLGIPTVNGWSGYPPSEWDYFADCESLLEWLAAKHRTSDEMIEGLALIGELSNSNGEREMALRKRFFVRPLSR